MHLCYNPVINFKKISMLKPLDQGNEGNIDNLKDFIVNVIGSKVAKIDQVLAKRLHIGPNDKNISEQLLEYVESKSKSTISSELKPYARPDSSYPDFNLNLQLGANKYFRYSVDNYGYLEIDLKDNTNSINVHTNLWEKEHASKFSLTKVRFFRYLRNQNDPRNSPFLRYEYKFLNTNSFGETKDIIPAFLQANNNDLDVWIDYGYLDKLGLATIDINSLNVKSKNGRELSSPEVKVSDPYIINDPSFRKAYNSPEIGLIYLFENLDTLIIRQVNNSTNQPDIVIDKKLDIPNMPIFSSIDDFIRSTPELQSGEQDRKIEG